MERRFGEFEVGVECLCGVRTLHYGEGFFELIFRQFCRAFRVYYGLVEVGSCRENLRELYRIQIAHDETCEITG